MKQRMIISFEPDQIYLLKRIAKEEKQSVSQLVRKAVKNYTKDKKKNPAKMLLKALDELHSKYKDDFKNVDPNLSKKIDKLLYDW